MISYISQVRTYSDNDGDKCAVYLEIASKIVETVAFEVAERESAEKVEEILALACEIEKVAAGLNSGT